MLNQKKLYELYRYNISWSDEDQEFVATCSEFPSLSWLEEDSTDAFNGIRTLVKEVLEDMEKNGESIPKPLPQPLVNSKLLA